MGDKYAAVRSASLQAASIRLLIQNASEELKRRKPPGKKKPRTKKELDCFLQAVGQLLAPFNVPVPAGSILDDVEQPRGPAWAVMVAMANSDQRFIDFAKQHGQIDTYLAALAISDPETHDYSSIECLCQSIVAIKKALESDRNSKNNAKDRPKKCPFKSHLKSVLKNHPEEKTRVLRNHAMCTDNVFKFNGRSISLTVTATSNIGLAWAATDLETGKIFKKKSHLPYTSFTKLISDVRTGR